MLFPLHRDAVSRVLRREPDQGRQCAWAQLFESNKADAGDAHSMYELRSKRAGQEPLEIKGIDMIIDEKTPVNGACKCRNVHGIPRGLRQRKQYMVISSFRSDYNRWAGKKATKCDTI